MINPSKMEKTIFLLGAGASIDAGIPTIDEMTKEFLKDPIPKYEDERGMKLKVQFRDLFLIEEEKTVTKCFNLLSKTAQEYFGRSDIELIMSLLIGFEEKKTRDLFSNSYKEVKEMFSEIEKWFMPESKDSGTALCVMGLRNRLEYHIRNNCERIDTVDYFWGLNGLMGEEPINIFTLNYDGTIEIFCEKNNIDYTDGFDPYWHPQNFEKNSRINLFKLHGSLYWIKTESDKILKIPIKGLNVSNLKYLTDEKVSEMLIYPALQKNKHSGIYSWLNQKFKDELKNSSICVIIGYSFRDDDIKNSLIESLLGNPDLWLIIVSPHAGKHKQEKFSEKVNFSSRIITMNIGVEEAIRDRQLHELLGGLISTRKHEDNAWISQAQTRRRLDDDFWNFDLYNYIKIEHHDRVKWIVEKLSEEKFSEIGGNFPTCIEGVVGPYSIAYLWDYYKNNNKQMNLWKKIFIDYSTALEFTFFNVMHPDLQSENPIPKTSLPIWCSSGGSMRRELVDVFLEQLVKIEDDLSKEQKIIYEKFLAGLLLMKNWYYPTEGIDTDATQFFTRYQRHDLGLNKWGTKLMDSIKLTK